MNAFPLAAARAEVSSQLKEAVRARDQVATRALRAALSALDHAGALPLTAAQPAPYGSVGDVPRLDVSYEELKALLLREAEKHSAAAAEYERLGYSERAEHLRREAAIIRGTLERVAAVVGADAR